jgi:hypothetical protein
LGHPKASRKGVEGLFAGTNHFGIAIEGTAEGGISVDAQDVYEAAVHFSGHLSRVSMHAPAFVHGTAVMLVAKHLLRPLGKTNPPIAGKPPLFRTSDVISL